MNKDLLKKLAIEDKKTKIQDLQVDEIINLKDRLPFERYSLLVYNYLSARIENNVYCTSEEIKKLRKLYSIFNSDENSSLKYLQKLYSYIDNLIYISKTNSSKSNITIKLSKITIKKLLFIQNQTYTAKFVSYIKRYINSRIEKRNYCSDNELRDLEMLINAVDLNEKIRDDQKIEIKKLVTKLIVFSKNGESKKFLKKTSNLTKLSLDELYKYLEIIINYAYFCIDENELRQIIMLLKSDNNYIEKVKELLNNSNIDIKFSELLNEENQKKYILSSNIS